MLPPRAGARSRTRCAGPTTSGTCTWPRPSPRRPSPPSSARCACKPDDLATLVWLGGVYLDQGPTRIGRAAVCAERCRFSRARCRRSSVWARRRSRDGSTRRAVDQFEQALAADPRASIAHYPLALAYRGLGEYGAGRSAPAPAGQRGSGSAGSVDGGVTRTASAARWPKRTAAFARSTAATSRRPRHIFARASNWRRTTLRSRHKLGTALSLMGDTQRRGRTVPGDHARDRRASRRPTTASVCSWRSAADTRRQSNASRPPCGISPTYVEARLRLAELLRRDGTP